jgi:glycosyltransferase involved in cell wall biosynthesis
MEAIVKASEGRIAGYMGEVNSVDIDLIGCLANENPNISFVFIGEICESVQVLKSFPNVHFLGRKSYRELPAYLQFFAVCCLFYKTQSAFNNYRNPKKLLEYFATGKPVVSVAIFELQYFRNYISIANSYSEFGLLLRLAISRDSPIDRQTRITFAEKQTWDCVAEGIASKFPPRLLGGGTDRFQVGGGDSKAETRAFSTRQ